MEKHSKLYSFIDNSLLAFIIFIVEQIILAFWMDRPQSLLFTIIYLVFYVVLIFFILKKEKILSIPKITSILKRMLAAVLFFLILLTAITVLTKLFIPLDTTSKIPENQVILTSIFKKNILSKILMIMYIAIFGPIIEEFCFRYLLIPLNSSKLYTVIGSIISTIIFTTLHLIGDFSNCSALINYTVISVGLVATYLLTRDIAQNTINHIFWNSILLIING